MLLIKEIIRGILNEERTRYYHCLNALLEITLDEDKESYDYEKALGLMYGTSTVLTCKELIKGQKNFYGLHSSGLSLEGFNAHAQLLQAYAKVQKVKR